MKNVEKPLVEPRICLEEVKPLDESSFLLNISLNGQLLDEFKLANPFLPEDNDRLDWYFESYIAEPYIAESRIAKAKEILYKKGEQLYQACFQRPGLEKVFKQLQNTHAWSKWTVEIKGDSPEFQAMYWEAMKPQGERPLSVLGVQFVRRGTSTSDIDIRLEPKPNLNLLIVTARPGEERDVNPHTIQRPLLERIREAGLDVRPHVLRPGTFKALYEHLQDKEEFYHIIHFDLHGSVLTYEELKKKRDEENKIRFHAFNFASQTFQVNWGLQDIQPFEGRKAFLFFESEASDPGKAIPVPANELAQSLKKYRIPVAILNACQSAKQLEASQEQSIAKALMDSGMQLVLGMSHSVSVSAADIMMDYLYRHLLEGKSLETSISRARNALYQDKNRKANLGQEIELEDWVLPQVYQNKEVNFQLRKPNEEEEEERLNLKYRKQRPPKPLSGFHGRELDILKIEKLLIDPLDHEKRRPLLLRGMVGVGKSSLLDYLAWWWEETQWVGQVVKLTLGLGHMDWEDLLGEMGDQVFPDQSRSKTLFLRSTPIQKRQRLLQAFKSPGTSWALIVDMNHKQHKDMKSVLRHQASLDFHAFIQDLPSRMIVLFGSRSGEPWLSEGTFGNNVYQLPGLRREVQYQMSRSILFENGLGMEAIFSGESARQDFEELLDHLQGFPSLLEKVIPLLKNSSVSGLLERFNEGSLWEEMLGEAPEDAPDLFVVYAHEDWKAIVKPLVRELEKAGISVWIDKYEIEIGDSILDKINAGISQAGFGLIVLTPAFFQSRWAKQEFKPFFSQQIRTGKKKILPIWHKLEVKDVLENEPFLADYKALILDSPAQLPSQIPQIIDAIQRERQRVLPPAKDERPSLQPPIKDKKPSFRMKLRQLVEASRAKEALELLQGQPELEKEEREFVAGLKEQFEALERDEKNGEATGEHYQKQLQFILKGLFELS